MGVVPGRAEPAPAGSDSSSRRSAPPTQKTPNRNRLGVFFMGGSGTQVRRYAGDAGAMPHSWRGVAGSEMSAAASVSVTGLWRQLGDFPWASARMRCFIVGGRALA